MDTLLISVSVGSIAFLLFIYSIIVRNKTIKGKNSAKRAWSDVISYQRRELRAIEKMGDAMREYKEFEREVQMQITQIRESDKSLSADNIDINALTELKKNSRALLYNLNARRENYPDLKTSKLFNGYMKEISENEMQVAASVTVFNQAVEYFNNYITMFPRNIVNAVFINEKQLSTFTDSDSENEFEYSPNF